ncbi:MAG: 4-hydroxy-tetrahydrodipicolinate synthase [Chloroflexi bacterium ADurb.Bin325]|nr:MAG: 4-hydroxy-tetrahydrodipicolinate synthase [Chloroflexi bacterium ADurb.Bin325]
MAGVFAPIVTPFRPADGAVDLPWLRQHIAYLAAHGCAGVVPCGTNGEAASLSVEERMQVTEAALAAARAHGLAAIVGTGASALPDAIALTRHAFAQGADAVLVMPPFYFKKPPEAGVVAWFRRLCDAATPPGGRVLLYHIPQTTDVPISDGVLDALLASHGEVIYGLKDSTGDPAQLAHFRAAYPQLAYYAGNDHRVGEGCAAGGAGSITAGANVFPDLVKAAQEAAWAGRAAGQAQATLSDARRLLDSFPLQPATKAALTEAAGLPETAVRPPQVELTAEQRAELRGELRARLPGWRSNRRSTA